MDDLDQLADAAHQPPARTLSYRTPGATGSGRPIPVKMYAADAFWMGFYATLGSALVSLAVGVVVLMVMLVMFAIGLLR
jgi:hypothetical protein